MLALLIAAQIVTRSLGQFITGSLVNMILLISVFMIGRGGGLAVALVSPFLAFFLGVGPVFIQIVPFIAVGNAILVFIAGFFRKNIIRPGNKDRIITAIGLAAAGVVKVVFLWIGVVIILLPFIPGIKSQQVTAMSFMFSWPQIVTALIGILLTMIIVPLLRRAVKSFGEL